jgi:hypothetical protein
MIKKIINIKLLLKQQTLHHVLTVVAKPAFIVAGPNTTAAFEKPKYFAQP